MIVTHNNFDACYDLAKRGLAVLYIPTAYRTTVINDKTIAKFEASGKRVVFPDTDGKGFRIRRGKRSDYVFQEYLRTNAQV